MGRVGREVHDDGEQIGARHPVDQRVVRLGQDGPAVVLESLDDPDLPEGLRPIELLGHDPPDELAQLGLAARCRQRGVAQVVLDVEVGIVHPDRPAELEGDEAHLLAVARHQVELGLDHVDHVGERRLGPLEDRHRGDVHVGDVVLDVQERGVQGAQPVRAHAASLSCPPPAVRGYYPAVRAFPLGGSAGGGGDAAGRPSEARTGVSRMRRRVSS